MPELIQVGLVVNGQAHELTIEPRETLAEVLRDRLALTGMKVSCDAQVCGACTVLVDGLPVSACTFLAADADGRRIRTVEGLAEGGRLSPLQQAFIDQRRLPVRVLHAGHADGRDGAPRGDAAPDPGRGGPRPRGQPLPLHRLRADRGGRAGRRRGRPMRRVVTRPPAPSPIGEAVPRRDGVGQGHRRRAVHRRHRRAGDGPREAPAEPVSPRPDPVDRRDRRPCAPGRHRGRDGRRPGRRPPRLRPRRRRSPPDRVRTRSASPASRSSGWWPRIR